MVEPGLGDGQNAGRHGRGASARWRPWRPQVRGYRRHGRRCRYCCAGTQEFDAELNFTTVSWSAVIVVCCCGVKVKLPVRPW